MLTGKEIQQQVDDGVIKISDFNPKYLGPNSYDLRLNDQLRVYKNKIIDAAFDNPTDEIIIPIDGLVIEPGRLYLGRTIEWTESGPFIPMLEGRSSIGRLGIFIHVTAGFGDVGYRGFWTLEIACIQPVRIYAGMRIGQIYYHKCNDDASPKVYSGKYQNSTDVLPSRMHVEADEWANFNRPAKL